MDLLFIKEVIEIPKVNSKPIVNPWDNETSILKMDRKR